MTRQAPDLSKCCRAKVRMESRPYIMPDLYTMWHECTKCGKPCDVAEPEPKKEETK